MFKEPRLFSEKLLSKEQVVKVKTETGKHSKGRDLAQRTQELKRKSE